jgi:Uma2 family endonuclease
MPTVVTETPYRPVPMDPRRKKWTRLECPALETLEVFQQQRLELVEGDLISEMGKKRPHTIALTLVWECLVRIFDWKHINTGATIDVAPEDNPTNEPEPDLILLAKASQEYPVHNPQPADLRLVVEIGDSTLGFDLTVKARLYAWAGIDEYWVVDVAA